jgi:hypothetical protein
MAEYLHPLIKKILIKWGKCLQMKTLFYLDSLAYLRKVLLRIFNWYAASI